MRVVAFIFLVGFLVGCKDEPRTTKCVSCFEDGVKIGAYKCKHCGADPYGSDLDRIRDSQLSVDEWFEEFPDGPWPWQRKWPWWKWPIMILLGWGVGFSSIPLLLVVLHLLSGDPWYGGQRYMDKLMGREPKDRLEPEILLISLGFLVLTTLLIWWMY